MNATFRNAGVQTLLIVSGLVLAGTTAAQYTVMADEPVRGRLELWIAATNWQGLHDLEPAAGGSFDQIGIGLGAAAHWPVRQLGGGEIMLGVEGAVMATESDVPVYLGDLMARNGYLALSAKWMFGKTRALALDAGLAWHLLDIAQLDSDYYPFVEFESWEDRALGPFLGVTWDLGAGKPEKTRGLSFGLKAHFVDFGTVRDEDVFIAPVLGPDAGRLNGPVYLLQIGYRWR